MFLPKLAFKNLMRYRRRTMITAGAIAYGLMMFVVMRSLLLSIDRESERNLIWYETGAGRVMAPGYWEDREYFPLEKSFDPAAPAAFLEERGADLTPRISFGGDLIFYQDPFPEDGNIASRFTAIDVHKDQEVFRIKNSLVEGRWLQEEEPELLMGAWLAEDIGAKPGYSVLVYTRTKDGYAQTFDLEVVGILDSPNPIVTRGGLYIPLSVADEMLEMNGHVTEISISLPEGKRGDQQFAELVPGVEDLGFHFVDWRVLGEDFVAVSKAKQGSTGMIVMLILIIAAVGISNTMLMAVFERVRELGMMRAMGMRDRAIRGLFLWESAGIGLIGGAYGVILGALVNWPLVKWGLNYSKLMRDANFGYRSQGHFYGVWDLPSFVAAFLLGVVISVGVAWFSTGRIVRMDIPSSLRHI